MLYLSSAEIFVVWELRTVILDVMHARGWEGGREGEARGKGLGN